MSKSARQLVGSYIALIGEVKAYKPNDRSEKDRYWAIAITELEKAAAVFEALVANRED